MRLRVIVFALVVIAVAVGLVVPSAGAKPKPVKPGQFVTYTCATGEMAGSGTVAWFDKDGQVISVSAATASGATLTAGPAPARAKSYEFRSVICIPPATTTTVAATTTSSSTTTTVAPTTTSSTTTTTVAPTTTTVAPTTTTVPDPTIHLTGSFTYPTDGEPRFIYGGDPSLRFPVCPAGTSLDLDASVINLPADVTLLNFLDSAIPSLIVEIPYIDPTGNGDYETRTITYDYACVPA
ncbi:MAG TPA: hypothetical protein VNT24_05935 [Propionibacteriaceae bacterium]|nr:hypothetical protein [Propionibacteriaceae bacterium]